MKRLTLLSLLMFFIVSFGFGQKEVIKIFNKKESQVQNQIVHPTKVSAAIYHDVLPSLKDLPPVSAEYYLQNKNKAPWNNMREEEIEGNYSNWKPMGDDPVWQKKMGNVKQTKGLEQNFAGQTSPYYPSDCNGTVGPNHFFQTVNSTYAIWDKTGTQVVAPTAMNTLFSGVTGSSNNDGDPLILWDEQANRWVAVEFSIAGTPDYMLIAVSQTSNPTGSWDRWSWVMNGMPDYEKLGISSDGYYMGTNTSSGDDVYVFERSVMLAGGASPQVIQFDNPNRPSTTGISAIMPIDCDGTFDTGSARFIAMNDDALGGSVNGGDELWIFDCVPNWSSPGSSTFGRSQAITVAAFDTQFNSFGSGEIKQSGVSQEVDANPYVLMTRGQYKNISGNEYIVCTHTVDVDATNHAGIRWYQLEKTAGTWGIKQQGTYAPDAHSRWMGSIAMNNFGQIALTYSTSSSTMSPEIRYTGQTSCATSGTMDVTEQTITASLPYQSQTSYTRWGDYFLTTVDPSDNLTFWSSNEYYNGGKKTQIFSFKIDESCSAPTISNVTPTSLYKDRGKEITITGTDFLGCTFTLGGIVGSIISNSGTVAVINFPAGDYANSNLIVENNVGAAPTQTVTINTRTTIPVVAGSIATSDNHPTIYSAVNGLHAWYGTTAFNAGDLPGTKTINVSAGTYTDEVALNSELNPTSTNPLIIQNNSGDVVILDATGNNYGFNLSTVDYVALKGFTVHGATNDNIYLQGDNCEISYNKVYNGGNSGVKVETGISNNIHNNLCYSNSMYGIHVTSSNSNIIKNNTSAGNGSSVSPAEQILLDEGFEGAFEPAGWSQYDDAGDNSTRVWSAGDFSTPVLGPDGSANFALISYDTPNVINRALETTSINLVGYASSNLEFYMYKNGTWDEQVFIEISTNGGGSGGTWTTLTSIGGSATDFGGWSPLQTVSLNAYVGNTINIRFRYYQPSDDNSVGIDVVKIKATPAAINTGAGLYVESGTGTTVENNIFVAASGNNAYFSMISENGVTVSSDYNTYYTTNTSLFNYNGTIDNIGPIAANDITTDPIFIGTGDYHIQSTADSYAGGEWPPLTATSGTWTTDGSNSPAIDAGTGAAGNEPASNGGIINQGTYGGTLQGSKTVAPGTVPTVSTQAVTSISCTTATGNGNITDLGNPNPTAYGVCWNTTGTPTTGDSFTDEGGTSSTGAFTSSITGLTAGTTYYVRAYATNTAGTSYGTEVNFTTSPTPGAAGSITGTATVCQGDNAVAYSVGAISEANSYTWAYTGTGATITGTTNSITIDFNATATSGDLTVYGTNGCGDGTASANYAITVNDCSVGYTISGTVKYDDASTTAVNGETIELYDNVPAVVATTTTDASGAYSFTNVADGTYTVKPTGSLAWGGATAMDVTLYKMHIGSVSTLTGLKLESGDVNASGSLTTADLTPDLQRIVAMINSFTAGDWAYTDGTVTVSGANETVNLSAICYGDANTSLYGAKSFNTINVENNSVIYVEDGDYFELQINLQNNITDLSSVTLNIPFDANKFEITNVSMENNNSNMYYNVENGVLRIAYSSLNLNNYVQGDKFLKITGFVNNITEETNISNNITGEFGDYNSNVLNSITFAMPSFSPKANSISEISKNIYIYPNPANNFLNILNAENSKVEVLNILGSKVLITQNIDKYNNRINTQNLATGTYILKVNKNNKVIMKKFTIIK